MAKLLGHLQKMILAMNIGEIKQLNAASDGFSIKSSAIRAGCKVIVTETRTGWQVERIK